LEQLEGYKIDITLKQDFENDAISQGEIDLVRAFFPELMRDTLYLLELEKE